MGDRLSAKKRVRPLSSLEFGWMGGCWTSRVSTLTLQFHMQQHLNLDRMAVICLSSSFTSSDSGLYILMSYGRGCGPWSIDFIAYRYVDSNGGISADDRYARTPINSLIANRHYCLRHVLRALQARQRASHALRRLRTWRFEANAWVKVRVRETGDLNWPD